MNSNYVTAGIVAVCLFAGAFFIGQRSTSYSLFGFSGTCIDTTPRK